MEHAIFMFTLIGSMFNAGGWTALVDATDQKHRLDLPLCEVLCHQFNDRVVGSSCNDLSEFMDSTYEKCMCSKPPIYIIASTFSTHRAAIKQLHYTYGKDLLTSYPYINSYVISAIAYVFKERKLLVARSNPLHRLEAYTLYSEKYAVMFPFFRSKALVVDDDRCLVFAISSHNTIEKFYTNGKKRIKVRKMSRNPLALAVDCKNEILYVTVHGKPFSSTYHGRAWTRLANVEHSTTLTVDNSKGCLYFNRRYLLYERSLQTGKEKQIIRLEALPRSVIPYGGGFLVTFMDEGFIHIINRRGNVRIANAGFPGFGNVACRILF